MALVQSMDVAIDQLSPTPTTQAAHQPIMMTPIWHEQAARQEEESHKHRHEPQEQEQEQRQEQGQGQGQGQRQEKEQEHSPIQRVDTPCPAALRREQHLQADSTTQSLSYVLLPDGSELGTRRRVIPLDAGQTTVVGRSKSSWIRDHHVSRRHVEITVPEHRHGVSTEECCRIKYIGRNCRVVLVGGILLKAEQEVPAVPGTRVILNFNNKGLPRYSYTLVPANILPSMVTSITTGRRPSGMGAAAAGGSGASANGRRWRSESLLPFSSSSSRPASGVGESGDGGGVGGGGGVGSGAGSQQQLHGDHAHNHLHRHTRHAALTARQKQQQQRQRPAGGRFRKESQDKLQKERDEIFRKFADLKFV
ncbi:unnamed protein product [Pylaiella littoralis]